MNVKVTGRKDDEREWTRKLHVSSILGKRVLRGQTLADGSKRWGLGVSL